MIPLPLYEQEELASLSGLPAYQLLLQTFADEVKYVEDTLATINPAQAAETLYYYQALRKIQRILTEAPQNIAQTFGEMRQNL